MCWEFLQREEERTHLRDQKELKDEPPAESKNHYRDPKHKEQQDGQNQTSPSSSPQGPQKTKDRDSSNHANVETETNTRQPFGLAAAPIARNT